MNDEQINAAIAEARGFVSSGEFQPNKNGPKFRFWDYPENWTGPNIRPWCPDFCNDLNAMHEEEKQIPEDIWYLYVNQLAKVTGAEESTDFEFMSAPARQRAEAFLRTLGKWEE